MFGDRGGTDFDADSRFGQRSGARPLPTAGAFRRRGPRATPRRGRRPSAADAPSDVSRPLSMSAVRSLSSAEHLPAASSDHPATSIESSTMSPSSDARASSERTAAAKKLKSESSLDNPSIVHGLEGRHVVLAGELARLSLSFAFCNAVGEISCGPNKTLDAMSIVCIPCA